MLLLATTRLTSDGSNILLISRPVLRIETIRAMEPCPSYMSELHVRATCPSYMSELHVRATCPSYMSELHVRATCPSYMSELHVRATCPSYMSELHVRATCPSYMSELHVRATLQAGTTSRCPLKHFLLLAGLCGAAMTHALAPLEARAVVAVPDCQPSSLPDPVPTSCLVSVSGQTYEIKTTSGVFGDGTNVGDIDLTQTPWWDPTDILGATARSFALAVGQGLGLLNEFGAPDDAGPYFASGLLAPPPSVDVKSFFTEDNGVASLSVLAEEEVATYAYAVPFTPHPESVPAPLPVLGAAAAFGYSRRLRKRIARSKTLPLASSID